MTKISESNGDRSIEEANEQRFREKVDREKRDTDARVERSFASVMAEKGRREQSERVAKTSPFQEQAKNAEQQVLKRLLDRAPKDAADLARRAALSRASHLGLEGRRKLDVEAAQSSALERSEAVTKHHDQEVAALDLETQKRDDSDESRSEERRAEKQYELGRGPEPTSVDADGQGRHRQERRDRDDGGSRERPTVEGPGSVDGPKKAHHVEIPREIIDKLVKEIAQAVAVDGRTSLRLELKGTGLEGITLTVSAERGRVQCRFEGCTPPTRRLLEGSRGLLARGLEERGLKLERMSTA